MATVDFLHHENPSTWAGVEPTTWGTESQRQTNHATQPTGVLHGYWTSGGGPVGGASRLGTWLLEDFLEKGVQQRESLPIGCWEVWIMAQMAARCCD
ncbi:hypothetical protein TNCV_1812241 [Trichonephila clavipes]|uniref:Uncharacterized protein n=1 Tax=Trichonephila clavipes TaxID=2585209 RepID=A0A8X7BGG5_TRICX|nr:hypothetical protein TNCV_1812241 [Trichonephila clavipes]